MRQPRAAKRSGCGPSAIVVVALGVLCVGLAAIVANPVMALAVFFVGVPFVGLVVWATIGLLSGQGTADHGTPQPLPSRGPPVLRASPRSDSHLWRHEVSDGVWTSTFDADFSSMGFAVRWGHDETWNERSYALRRLQDGTWEMMLTAGGLEDEIEYLRSIRDDAQRDHAKRDGANARLAQLANGSSWESAPENVAALIEEAYQRYAGG